MRKIVLFVRVSTDKQHLESQEDELRRAAMYDGYKEEDFVVIGKKESAIKLDEYEREGLNELKELIAQGNVDCVYINEISRLSRRPNVLYSIRDQLKDAKVQLICQNPSFRLLKDNDRSSFDQNALLMFSLFAGFAEGEMMEKKERFRRGKRRAALDGRYNGGAIPFGYKIDYDRNKRIVLDEKDALRVKEIYDRYEAGETQLTLAKM